MSRIPLDDAEGWRAAVENNRDALRDTVNAALEQDRMPQTHVKIPDDERQSLDLAYRQLYTIDELVKIVDRLSRHEREHAFSCLCSVIGAEFVIGTHASESKTQLIFQQGKAQSRRGKSPRNPTDKQIRMDALIARCRKVKPNATDSAIVQWVLSQWGYKTPPPDRRTVERYLAKQK